MPKYEKKCGFFGGEAIFVVDLSIEKTEMRLKKMFDFFRYFYFDLSSV